MSKHETIPKLVFQLFFYYENFSTDLYKSRRQPRVICSRARPSRGVGNPSVPSLCQCTRRCPIETGHFPSQNAIRKTPRWRRCNTCDVHAPKLIVCHHHLSTVSDQLWNQYGNPILFPYLPSTSHTNLGRIWNFLCVKG